jgi:bacteriorhodopsin
MKFALVFVFAALTLNGASADLNWGYEEPTTDDDKGRLTFGPDVDGSLSTPKPTPHPTDAPKHKAKPKNVEKKVDHHAAHKGADHCANAEGLSEQGQKYLKAGFVGMALPAAYFMSQTFAVPEGSRKYHIVTTFVCLIASLAYLSMATGHGIYIRSFDCREFYYARYIDWALTTPLMLIDLLGFAGASTDTTTILIGVDVLMIISGLIGGFLEGNEKYYFWIFGMVMYAPIVYYLSELKKSNACTSNQKVGTLYSKICNLTLVAWSLYPLVWLVAEGNGSISADQEALAYTILDVCAKSVFGYIIISAPTNRE